MASSRSKKKKPVQKKQTDENRSFILGEILVWIVLAVCIILLIGNFGFGGSAGRLFASFFFGLFGFLSYLFPFFLFFLVAFAVSNRGNKRAAVKTTACAVLFILFASLIQLFGVTYNETASLIDSYHFSAELHRGGGITGAALIRLLYPTFGKAGAVIIILVLMIICLVLITEKAFLARLGMAGKDAVHEHQQVRREKRERAARVRKERQNALTEEEEESEQFLKQRVVFQGVSRNTTLKKSDKMPMKEISIAHAELPETPDEEVPFKEDAPPKKRTSKKKDKAEAQKAAESVAAEIEKEKAAPPVRYHIPPLSLLKRGGRKGKGMTDAHLKQIAGKLERTLASFGVHATVTNISCGPSVTRYELTPEVGVKVSRIVNLSDDIKLNLAVPDIRIEAPIPGKAAIGIEVPNSENTSIMLRDLLESDVFQNHRSKIAFAVGMDIAGKIIVADIYDMPHLLIGGATGSGKSVCINTLIMSILYKASPDEVRFIMIDPKMIELNLYNGIPHLYIPVVTDPKKAAGALQWAVAEMTKRYKLFSELNVKNLKGYNEKVRALPADSEEQRAPIPQIVIVVDEFADLMMVASGEVEEAVCRLAQLARAAGIHLILATQRPSVDVITGLIKANMPSRIALAVSSGIDSRTIIDMIGAEKLLGKGDMLFYPSGYPKPVRVQGAYVSEQEVEDVVSYIISHNGDAAYDEEIASEVNARAQGSLPGMAGAASSGDERDPYFAEAGRFIIDKDKASIGMLQRVFKIGFNRAARIMDSLADAGVVGEEEGTKPRRILMNAEQFERYLSGEEDGGDDL